MRNIVFAAMLALPLAPAAGQAADLGVAPAPQLAPVYLAETGMDWSGFYAGFNAGYGFGHEDAVDLQAFPDEDELDVGDVVGEGWLGGVQAGYNLQSGNLVFGLEGDLQGASYSGASLATVEGITADATTEIDWFGTIRPRVGFAVDDALFYATGGLAFGGMESSIAVEGTDGYYGTLSTAEDVAWGYTIGAGAEYAVTDSISLKGEYQFVQLHADATGAIYDTNGDDTGVAGSSRVHSNMHAVKVGLNFHF